MKEMSSLGITRVETGLAVLVGKLGKTRPGIIPNVLAVLSEQAMDVVVGRVGVLQGERGQSKLKHLS